MPQYPDPMFNAQAHDSLGANTLGPSHRIIPSRTTPIGFIQVVEPTRLVGGNHDGTTMDEIRWTTSSISGAVTLYEGEGFAKLVPGTVSGGMTTILTSTRARYITPFPNFVYIACRTQDEGVAGNIRQWGASNAATDNYVGFELSGTTKRLIVKRSGSDQVAFNAPFPMSTADRVHSYEIWWWNERIEWYVDGMLMYEYIPTGSQGAVLNNMTLRAGARSQNLSSIPAGSGVLEFHEGSISRMGPRYAQPYWYHSPSGQAFTKLLKKGPGTLFSVTINSPTNAQSNASLTLYDNQSASGSIIAVIDTAKIPSPQTLHYTLDFSEGLYAVGQASLADVTLVFD